MTRIFLFEKFNWINTDLFFVIAKIVVLIAGAIGNLFLTQRPLRAVSPAVPLRLPAESMACPPQAIHFFSIMQSFTRHTDDTDFYYLKNVHGLTQIC